MLASDPYYFFFAATVMPTGYSRVQFLLDQIMVLNPVLDPTIIFLRNFGSTIRPNFVDRGRLSTISTWNLEPGTGTLFLRLE